jgi:hypothetical protein
MCSESAGKGVSRDQTPLFDYTQPKFGVVTCLLLDWLKFPFERVWSRFC